MSKREQILEQAYDLLCEIEGEIDLQTYDDKRKVGDDIPDDCEFNIIITAKTERQLSRALKLIEELRIPTEATTSNTTEKP